MYNEEIPYKEKTSESTRQMRQEYWENRKGLQKVDGLLTSQFLEAVAKEHIEGRYTSDEALEHVRRYYNEASKDYDRGEREADEVSARMVRLLEKMTFKFSPVMLKSIHRELFFGVLPDEYVGEWRTCNLTKEEAVLGGRSVQYGDWNSIQDYLQYDFGEERGYRYQYPFRDTDIQRFAQFISGIWQTHPFREGNTRTTAMFIQLYAGSMGLKITNEPFRENAMFFRNALVRSNFSDIPKGIYPDFSYLEAFFDNVFCNAGHDLSQMDLVCHALL